MRFLIAGLATIIVVRLFVLQVLDASFYDALAEGQYTLYEELFPERGDILVQDLKDGTTYVAATNVDMGFVFADPRRVEDADKTAESIGAILGFSDEEISALEVKLEKENDPYEPIKRRVPEVELQKIETLNLAGIDFVREGVRTYPESGLGGQLFGFVGGNDDGSFSGKYGIEGSFDEEMAGQDGYVLSERDAAGRFIAVGERSFEPAVDGVSVVLTIDRTIQYTACEKLKEAVIKYDADGGSVVILDPKTGAVLAMCSDPDFDPNKYNEVSDVGVFQNAVIFNAYEPGSIFKAVTMASALDTGAVTPATTFTDTGSVVVDEYTITNAEEKVYGVQTMTQVLESSVNTGVIFAMQEMGKEKFAEYVERFGFGTYTGIELFGESAGDVSSLKKTAESYAATASFGHGITVTPLQMASAFAVMANDGKLMQPYVVAEMRSVDGTSEVTTPYEVRQVVSEHTARLISAMLISVVENGHGKRAGVEGYYIAGKTGTAEVPREDGLGYQKDVTIGSFAGYGPVGDPKFAMVVRLDRPRAVRFAESSAAPLFGEIAEFLLRYFEVPPQR
ncbi:MAG: penicillin-binding protein 2 [Patescibacteria group bacterium]